MLGGILAALNSARLYLGDMRLLCSMGGGYHRPQKTYTPRQILVEIIFCIASIDYQLGTEEMISGDDFTYLQHAC